MLVPDLAGVRIKTGLSLLQGRFFIFYVSPRFASVLANLQHADHDFGTFYFFLKGLTQRGNCFATWIQRLKNEKGRNKRDSQVSDEL